MIRRDDLTEIGAFYKTHGIKGELSAGLDYDLDLDELRCIVLDVDGIFVPFFIESWRLRGPGRYLIKLMGVDDESEASLLAKHPFYGLTDELPESEDDDDEGFYLYDLVGFELFSNHDLIGKITRVDDSTANILLIVENAEGNAVYVPFAEEWIEEFDHDNKTIVMNLPDGIIDLNN